ncbi:MULTISPECIES: M20 metallopeptidase family protein [Eubacteriales]|uniref:Amidohydrolase n=1 Tax=Bittarella massiliensis (ex Durand et al. 2017) TaxID=1720313 RepID=A0AAQ1RUP1_9FIRM|nr:MULTISPECIES: amidohydrolase [Eubacteriales]ERI99127.1 amidohydrolase [Clostridium sp. ATCC 29733]MZL70186.1 amidohydrolase [Bittarella massiliensis (ex Durand et al. 2017)]SHF63751.1 amidohydrolase [Bittarella massiliensis (ex Durand et al. 2017)]
MDLHQLVKSHESYVVERRREFHMHPELSLQEEWTSGRIAEELGAMGIPYEIVGRRNVVGVIEGGKPGKSLAIRADFDALPLEEETDVPYKSQIPGCMHACGHDAHAAMLLGTGKALLEIKDQLAGKVYLCFQIAEEAGQGADEIVEYLQGKGGVDQAIGIHVLGDLNPGTLELVPGARLSGAEIFYIDVKGVGGHGSRPDLTVDPIKATVDCYQRLITIPVNHHSMFDTCVVSPCAIKSGDRFNIVPETGHIEGTIRYYKYGDGQKVLEKIRQTCEGVCASHGCTVEVTSAVAAKFPLINDPAATEDGRQIAQEMGLELVDGRDPSAASDNFAEFLAAFPGFYANLGCHSTRPGTSGNHHNPTFDVDESALPLGVEFFVRYTSFFLGQ